MTATDTALRAGSALVLLLAFGACAPAATRAPAPGLPPVPRVDGPLRVSVVHPTPRVPLPRVDSTFIFGSVGSGRATLTINGAAVDVAPNGAFLGYVQVPADGRYELIATRGDEIARGSVSYRMPEPAPPVPATPAPPAPPAPPFTPVAARVSGVSDTLATGSDAAAAYPVPSTAGARGWMLPDGAQLTLVGEQGELVEARLAPGVSAWLPRASVAIEGGPAATPANIGAPSLRSADRFVDLRVPGPGIPFRVLGDARTVELELYGIASRDTPVPVSDPLITDASWAAGAEGVSRLRIRLAEPLWGYKAFYEADGTLVLRLRRTPAIDARRPLRGIRIVVDPGHPPGGATGPTGLTEAEANLDISLRLADRLRRAGADVLLTRTENVPVALAARVEQAVDWNADLLVSVHNNAFGEGANPFRRHGTSVLYYHPHSLELAETLNASIVHVTRIPDLGAIHQNIALGRPTWMPSVLTESLFMMFPEQENALRHPGFLDRLAAAHVHGIERFLRARAEVAGRAR